MTMDDNSDQVETKWKVSCQSHARNEDGKSISKFISEKWAEVTDETTRR